MLGVAAACSTVAVVNEANADAEYDADIGSFVIEEYKKAAAEGNCWNVFVRLSLKVGSIVTIILPNFSSSKSIGLDDSGIGISSSVDCLFCLLLGGCVRDLRFFCSREMKKVKLRDY